MMPDIKEKIYSERLSIRILWLTVAFVVIFYEVTILSYFLLPEGFLLKKNSVTDFYNIEELFGVCNADIFI